MNQVSSLDKRREQIAENELVWTCRRPIKDPDGIIRECDCETFYVHIDAAIECSNCGLKTKDWMESI